MMSDQATPQVSPETQRTQGKLMLYTFGALALGTAIAIGTGYWTGSSTKARKRRR
jgi:hypothetical protein